MGNGKVKQAIIISDLHAGCQFGLCPSSDIPLDGGGYYKPSLLQKKVWSWWEEFWKEWVPRVTRDQPYIVIINGDTTDGRHHGAVTQISQNLSDQKTIARLILQPIVAQCEGRFFMIRGTETHVGASGENEESLARELDAIPDETGNHSRWEMWLRLGDRLAHITHHIGMSQSMAYETTAPMREYDIACSEAARWGYPRPDICIRSHRHRHSETKVPTAQGDGICTVTPGWQLRTPFIFRLMGKNLLPQFGGILWRVGDEEHYTRHFIRNITRTPEVVL
ncbi:MAG: hypothetical protein PHS93_07780 [Candidatus Omnitrophica bacterium]|nr:hypothetical protein [Candidatus Omnitrophota bacterium]